MSLAALALMGSACTPAEQPGPELILTGGRVYADATSAPVQALAIEGDRVSALGTDAEIRALAVDDTQEMALDGSPVFPGMVDAWIDLEAVGRDDRVDLVGAVTPREIQARLRTALGSGDGWLVGFGWNETVWPRRETPDATLLDAVSTTRPILLYRRIGRVGWLNSAALAAAGVDDDTLAAADGSATALVAGDALRAVEEHLDAPRTADRERWVAAGARAAAAAGVTRAMTPPLGATALRLLARTIASGDLPLRVDARIGPGVNADDLDPVGPNVIAVGVEVDGPLSLGLAALGTPDTDGRSVRPGGTVDRACDQAARLGLPLHAHAYGDAAIAAAAACIESVGGLVIGADLLPLEGVPAGLRIAAVPMRLGHDLYWLEARLGAERARRAHAYRDIAEARLLRGIASRAPEYPLAPMRAIRVVNRRQDGDGFPRDGFQPGQRLTVADALQAALGTFLVDGAGRIAVGAPADLTIWSDDPLEEAEALDRAQAMVVIIGGRVVYSRPLVDLPMERR